MKSSMVPYYTNCTGCGVLLASGTDYSLCPKCSARKARKDKAPVLRAFRDGLRAIAAMWRGR